MPSQLGNPTTAGEVLFQQYLAQHGYPEPVHEEPIQGKRKCPDFRLDWNGQAIYAEVKEWAPQPVGLGYGALDVYGPIREKINQATRQFREYRAQPCVIVLANPRGAFVPLDHHAIIGAMFGNFGFSFSFGVVPNESHPIQTVFLAGGKMVNMPRRAPQNTTISAVAVVHSFSRYKRIQAEIRVLQDQLGRATTGSEEMGVYERFPDNPGQQPVCMDVYENPYARLPLPGDIFRGPYDQRWSMRDKEIFGRTFVGEELRKIEIIVSDSAD